MRDRHTSAYERALAFCRARRLFRPGDRVLVGSGSGAASLGVLGFLRLAESDLGLGEIAVGAVDLGGDDAADAVADTGRFARLVGVSFYAVSADGRSPLASLRALAARERFTRIALGHTRDDAVAHVLARLARGVPLARLRPLVACRRDGVVRPLLDLRDAEALELARTAGIEPVAMPPEPGRRPSLETRLRASVLPRLRVEVHGCDGAILRVARDARRWSRHLAHEVDALLAREVTLAPGRIEIPRVPMAGVLAEAVADAVLRRLQVPPSVRRSARPPLARMLKRSHEARQPTEVVLGPGLIATIVPERQVIVLRSSRRDRAAGQGIG